MVAGVGCGGAGGHRAAAPAVKGDTRPVAIEATIGHCNKKREWRILISSTPVFCVVPLSGHYVSALPYVFSSTCPSLRPTKSDDVMFPRTLWAVPHISRIGSMPMTVAMATSGMPKATNIDGMAMKPIPVNARRNWAKKNVAKK